MGLSQVSGNLFGSNALARLAVALSRSAALVRFLFREAGWLPHVGRRGAWRAFVRGFSPRAFTLYELDRNDPMLYLSDYGSLVRSVGVNAQYDFIINNKLIAWTLLTGLSIPAPSLLGVIEKGRLRAYPECPGPVRLTLQELLQQHRKLVLKPVRGLKGLGVIFLEQTEARITLNGSPLTGEQLQTKIQELDGFIVTEFVAQAAYARRFYPRTTNTVRLLTVWDSTRDQPFVASAVQRIGTSRSFPVDNWRAGQGGLSASVNLATGELGPGASMNPNGRLLWCDSHPETGQRIAGEVIPGWVTVTEGVLAAATRLFFAPLIGWDVVVCEEGFSVLEINGKPGVWALQSHQPLLADPRVRRFYREHGVIRA